MEESSLALAVSHADWARRLSVIVPAPVRYFKSSMRNVSLAVDVTDLAT